jgi:hypothetical protein
MIESVRGAIMESTLILLVQTKRVVVRSDNGHIYATKVSTGTLHKLGAAAVDHLEPSDPILTLPPIVVVNVRP